MNHEKLAEINSYIHDVIAYLHSVSSDLTDQEIELIEIGECLQVEIIKPELEYYHITSLSKDDIAEIIRERSPEYFKGKKRKALKVLESLDDATMEHIASKLADALIENGGYWETLEELFKEQLEGV